MKFLAVFFAISAAGSVSAMCNNRSILNFFLNKDYSIKAFYAQNVPLKLESSKYVGKNIFDAISFSEGGKKALTMGLLTTVQENKIVNIAYAGLENGQGLATIMPMQGTDNNFYVRIQELDNQ